jgi:hypothetical protein
MVINVFDKPGAVVFNVVDSSVTLLTDLKEGAALQFKISHQINVPSNFFFYICAYLLLL